ncbi:hypothetical protein [Rhodococcus koreensis]
MRENVVTDELRLLPAQAAQFIRRYPVPPRGTYAPELRISILDVFVHCAAVRGDAFVAFQLLRRSGLPGEYYLHVDVVHEALMILDQFEVTEDECTHAFGPNWREVVRHAVEVADILHRDFHSLTRTVSLIGSHRRLSAWIAARDVAWEAGRIKSWYRAQDAAWEREYMDDATVRLDDRLCADTAAAVRDAAAATALSDLVGMGDFTRAHYETLVAPWHRAVKDIRAAAETNTTATATSSPDRFAVSPPRSARRELSERCDLKRH